MDIKNPFPMTESTVKDISFLGVLTSHISQTNWEIWGIHFYTSWWKGETCQGLPNSIKEVGGKSLLPVGGNGKFWWGEVFFHRVGKICWGVILTIQAFSKAKNNILYVLNIDKIKISMACVYNQYEVKTKMVQKQQLQLKMMFLLGCNMKNVV